MHSGRMYATRCIVWRVRNQILHVQNKFSQNRRNIFLDSTVCVLSFWGFSNVTDMISLGGEREEERERELRQN